MSPLTHKNHAKAAATRPAAAGRVRKRLNQTLRVRLSACLEMNGTKQTVANFAFGKARRKNPMSKDLKYLCAGVSLVMLALGFSLLGILSFVYHALENSTAVSDLENNYNYLGSGVSIFAGA